MRPLLCQQLFLDMRHAGDYQDDGTWILVNQGQEANGEVLQLAARWQGDTLLALRFKAYGCVELYAAAELLCRRLPGKSRAVLLQFEVKNLLSALTLPRVKDHITLMVTHAWQDILTQGSTDAH